MSRASPLSAPAYSATEIANLHAARTGVRLHPAEVTRVARRMGIAPVQHDGRAGYRGEDQVRLAAALPVKGGDRAA